MITLFELKNRPFCRFFYKIPYAIKNLFLLTLLGLVLLLNYFSVIRNDTMTIQNVYRYMAGLDSEVFNWLLEHDQELQIKDHVKSLSVSRVTSVDFYSYCVALNRPCLLPVLAKTWPAFQKWTYAADGYTYLQQLVGPKTPVTVYLDEAPVFVGDDLVGYSFSEEDEVNMVYGEYL